MLFALIFVEFFANLLSIMKNFLLAAALLMACSTAMAEGYQINTLSARQLGMGHTGTALKLGAENMIFNPAGLAFSDKTLDITASMTAIKAIAKCTPVGSETTYQTDNGFSTPMAVNAAFRIYDNLQAGVSFYTPYGSGINWTRNWPGSVLSQKVDLKVFTVQPTVSWRILPNLSVGAGLMISWGQVDLNKALVSGESFDQVMAMQGYPSSLGHAAAASVGLTGTSKVAVGVNVGAMYDINSQWTVGVDFRSKMTMKVDAGLASVSYANQMAESVLESQIGLINESNFSSQMPCPYVWNFGVAYRPTDRWTVALDAQLTGWNTYKQLDVNFPEPLAGFSQHIEKNYSNSWCFKVGAQWVATKRLDLRAGLNVDSSPVSKSHYNPETPGMTKVEPTIGLSFRPINQLSIDVAFMYIHGLGIDGASCSYDDLLLRGAGMPESVYQKTFTADYKVKAFAPSIGLSYSF